MTLDRDGALRLPAGGGQRPGFVRAGALIGDHAERLAMRRKRQGGATGEAARRVRNAGQSFARMKI
jgi:hypothetical protein